MKKNILLLYLMLCLISCSQNCNHLNGQHIPNDTLYCKIIDKKKTTWYNPVLHIPTIKKKVKIMKSNNQSFWSSQSSLYNTTEIGDTIYEIHHHCPFEYIEIKVK